MLLEFVEGVRRGYTQPEASTFLRRLAKLGWLSTQGPFVEVKELGDAVKLPVDDRGEGADPKVLQLLGAAGARVLNLLRELTHSADAATFGQQAIHRGWVKRSGAGWVPSGASGLQISEVLMGMVAADALADASAYDRDLSVCSKCGIVGFGARVSGRTTCDDHTFRTSERLRAAARRDEEPSGVTSVRPSERRISLPVRAIGDDD